MKEIRGNLWDFYGKPGYVVCITTNGTLKKNGEAVMGRGCAKEAQKRIPRVAAKLGILIAEEGNVLNRIPSEMVLAFPVKHNWWEKADLTLIRRSAEQLKARDAEYIFILPRPGCGNGQRDWLREVKPLLEAVGLPDNVWVISP